MEKKHKCTLDFGSHVSTRDHTAWTIGIHLINKKRGSQALCKDLYDLVFSFESKMHQNERLYLAYDLAIANPHLYHPANNQKDKNREDAPIVWQHEGSSRHLQAWMVVLETHAIHEQAVSVLVGPRGFGIRAIKGNTRVFCCALEYPRIGLFLVGEHLSAVQQCLVRARERLTWAQKRSPSLFDSPNASLPKKKETKQNKPMGSSSQTTSKESA